MSLFPKKVEYPFNKQTSASSKRSSSTSYQNQEVWPY